MPSPEFSLFVPSLQARNIVGFHQERCWIERMIGNPHINKTDIELAMLFVCQNSSEAYVDRNEPIAIPAGWNSGRRK